MIAPRTATVIALVAGVTAGASGVAMMLADAVAAGPGNGYGYCKGKAPDSPTCPVERRRAHQHAA